MLGGRRGAVLAGAVVAAWPVVSPFPAGASPVDECQAKVTTQVEVSACLVADLRAAEQALATALGEAQGAADEIDRATGRPGARGAVDAAQARWLEFREADCAVRSALAAGGSGAGQFAAGCTIELTRGRTRELQALAHGAW